MTIINTGTLVMLRFPFADGSSYKRRPALVIKDFVDGDILVCRVTSKIYCTPFDIYLDNWVNFGLKLPSVVRVNKMATLEKNLVESILGTVDEESLSKIKSIYFSIIK